ncbi:alkaline phosphatase [Candidatus Poribacteria bacterium]|nr:alkaline phosphatase [Candidatus Poribacteria bacterium]
MWFAEMDCKNRPPEARYTRRDWLRLAGSFGAALGVARGMKADNQQPVVFGLVADTHYADRDPAHSRHYRDSLPKMQDAVEAIRRCGPAFCVHLGDVVDKGSTVEEELAFLATIRAAMSEVGVRWHRVLGNHDVAALSKRRFLDACEAKASRYSFDHGGAHFVVLDACHNADGSDYDAGNFDWTQTFIPQDQLRWLSEDLAATENPTFVFVHQRLDDDGGAHGVKNAPDVRDVLQASGHVRAVFQGHDHRGARSRIGGIDYYTMRAQVEGPGRDNNAFSVVRIGADGVVSTTGYGRQEAYDQPSEDG